MTRILLFTGKGGVGKTTTAAATAAHAARRGVRTLVLSTDPAHSLADAVGAPIGSEPTPLDDHLHGQQLDATERMEESWSEIRSWLVEVFDWAGADAVEAEELSVVPGLDEVFALADLKRFASSGEWDLLVVDCAPTAETIRLLSLPDVLAWYMDRVFPTTRRVARIVGPVLQRVGRLPVAGDEVFGATARLYERLDGAKELLTDPDRTSDAVRPLSGSKSVPSNDRVRSWSVKPNVTPSARVMRQHHASVVVPSSRCACSAGFRDFMCGFPRVGSR